jgi:hypothetical protein
MAYSLAWRLLTSAPLAHHDWPVSLPARSSGIQSVDKIRVIEMDFVGVESHDWAVLLMHLRNLPEILPTQPNIVIDLIPVSECCK